MNQRVYLVGSIPLADSEEVFRTCADILGDRVKRLPDGEVGERRYFVDWHIGVMAQARDQLEWVSPPADRYPQLPSFRLRKGADVSKIRFPSFGYAKWARQSYELFRRLKQEGMLADDLRLQVNVPAAITPVIAFADDPETSAAIEDAYERSLLAEVEEIGATIPNDELAIQADIVFELALWERLFPPYFGGDPEQGVLDRIGRFAAAVPEAAELGLHLCYGDYQHKHFMQPNDLGVVTAMSNAFAASFARRIDYIHMPVPRDRDDVAYFEPLADLQLATDTELYLGLVHYTDGVEGALSRIEAAERTLSSFGIATECGFGRRAAETVPKLLEIHRDVVDRRVAV